MKKYFSLREANELLPELRPLLQKVVDYQIRMEMEEDIAVEFEDSFEQYVQSIRETKQHHKTYFEYFDLLEKIADLGVLLKDERVGIVDFFAKHNGEDIFLCYHLGEKRITHWHKFGCGFENRKHVKFLEKKV